MAVKVKFIGVALLCMACSSGALTLGRVRGAVLVGQPLNVVVPVQMEAQEEAASLCFKAEVFHADTRQEASRVRVLIEASPLANAANVRILSSSLIDEPVVTVYLHTGCGQKTTRRYVLLTDLPSEVAVPAEPRFAPMPPAAESVPVVVSAAPLPESPVKAKPARLPAPKVQQDIEHQPAAEQAVVDVPRAARARKPSTENSKLPRAGSQSRLKLDPLELFSDRIAHLDSAMTFEPPEDAVRSMQRIQVLEGAVKAGQVLAAKNEASLADMQTRLQKAESASYPVSLLYGLIALLLACFAGLAFLWQRQRRASGGTSNWWHASGEAQDTLSPALEGVDLIKPAKQAKTSSNPPPQSPVAEQAPQAAQAAPSDFSNNADTSDHVDVNLTEMTESTFGDFMLSGHDLGSSHQAPPEVHAAEPVAPKALVRHKAGASFNSEAILDVRQQADFFVSLGQTDRAVRIFKKKIEESDDPNPFYYLDLLDIFHSLGLKIDFEQYRSDFNQLFRGKVPEFVSFKTEGKSLEAYPEALARITALWPTPGVLSEIESCIFEDATEGKTQSFELAAFRDLLLLHALAQSLASTSNADSPHPVSEAPVEHTDPVPSLGMLDLDLSDTSHMSMTLDMPAVDDIEPLLAFSSENLIDFDVTKAPNT